MIEVDGPALAEARHDRSGGTTAWTCGGASHRRAAARGHVAWLLLTLATANTGCSSDSEQAGLDSVVPEVEEAVWRFHAADTARDAEAVIALLWPEFEMMVDGGRVDYDAVVEGSRAFMGSLASFDTDWSDLRVLPLSESLALSSFFFRDSIVTSEGELIQAQGPTTLVWERRGGEWRMRHGDADHYPVEGR